MILMCAVGQAGAGKTTAASILKEHGFAHIEAGDIVRDRYTKEGLAGETLLSFAERLFSTEGYDLHVERIVESINRILSTSKGHGIVVSGLRTAPQIERLSDFFMIMTVAIYASPEIRFRRILARSRSDDPQKFLDFIREDYRELAWGLSKVLFDARHYILNENSIADLDRNLLSLLSSGSTDPTT